jgi:hypothetical protein
LYLDFVALSAWLWADMRFAAVVCRELARSHDRSDLPGAGLTWDYEVQLSEWAAATLDIADATRDATGARHFACTGALRRVVAALPTIQSQLLASGTRLARIVAVVYGRPNVRLLDSQGGTTLGRKRASQQDWQSVVSAITTFCQYGWLTWSELLADLCHGHDAATRRRCSRDLLVTSPHNRSPAQVVQSVIAGTAAPADGMGGIMRFDLKAFALACGLVWGVGVAVLTWWIMAFEGASSDPTWLGLVYRGYSLTFTGSLLGALWGFVDGMAGGAVFAWVYNRLLARRPNMPERAGI